MRTWKHHRQKWLLRYLFTILILLWSVNLASSQGPTPEYQVKAVFLYNFTQFVQWPVKAFDAADEPLVIGILGKDPFGNYLDETVKNEKADQHPLVVRRFQKTEEIKKCHILFINVQTESQQKEVIEKLKGQNILTVGDGNSFVRDGGMIRLYAENNKTRIRINLEAVKNADLNISSKLLRLAEIVSP